MFRSDKMRFQEMGITCGANYIFGRTIY